MEFEVLAVVPQYCIESILLAWLVDPAVQWKKPGTKTQTLAQNGHLRAGRKASGCPPKAKIALRRFVLGDS